MNSERTRHLAWFTENIRPALRRPAAAVVVIPGLVEPITQELPAVLTVTPPRRAAGRHRRPSMSLLARLRRAVGRG